MQSVDTTASFVYNENGLRVQKTVNGVVTDYTLHGKNVVHMKTGNDELHFFYDASNKPAVVVFNGTPYSYVKNLQGDIVAILNSAGTAVVSYKYDAWGRPISKTGSMAATLGTVQPFRYRSYVFDEETGLYYLRSRYYSIVTNRFVNADVVFGSRKLVSHNLFAYCRNGCVSKVDHTGLWEMTIYSELSSENMNDLIALMNEEKHRSDKAEELWDLVDAVLFVVGLGNKASISQYADMVSTGIEVVSVTSTVAQLPLTTYRTEMETWTDLWQAFVAEHEEQATSFTVSILFGELNETQIIAFGKDGVPIAEYNLVLRWNSFYSNVETWMAQLGIEGAQQEVGRYFSFVD